MRSGVESVSYLELQTFQGGAPVQTGAVPNRTTSNGRTVTRILNGCAEKCCTRKVAKIVAIGLLVFGVVAGAYALWWGLSCKTLHCKVFQDSSCECISEELFAKYQNNTFWCNPAECIRGTGGL